MHKLQKIISGGQTGVDQAALRVALELGLETGGWCPPDRACESGTIPEHFPLVPTPVERSPNAPHIPRSLRTEWNVRDSDATLVLVPDTIQNDAGTNWTIECAKRYSKPVCAINPFSSDASVKIYNWLSSLDISTLNVAGPSEKTCTGIGTIAEKILRKAFLLSSSKLKLVSAMEPQATESLSDYELERGKPMPNFNHGYIQANLIVALRARYGRQFSVVSEVAMPVGDRDATPDVLVFPKRVVNWFETKSALSEPPILAIEIQSPSQPMEVILDKAKAMLDHRVKSVWIVQPALKTVSVFTKEAEPKTFVEGTVSDKASGIELSFEEIFATE